jgi:glycolate oxidase FAD binding subunit
VSEHLQTQPEKHRGVGFQAYHRPYPLKQTLMQPDTLRPADAPQAAEIIARAAAENTPLRIHAGNSKQTYGRPVETHHTLDLSHLSGILDYEPAELFISARAATPLQTITDELEAHGQMLAFEPPDWRALLHTENQPTIGGTVACNLAGPRRVRAGAARDHFLGFNAINGRGEPWKAGGKVVKNVTGYDMCKLQAGAFGTLSVLLDCTMRLLPKPETSCTVLYHGLSDAEAVHIMSAALNSPHEVSAAAHLPAHFAARSASAAGIPSGQSVTALRLEGPRPSVAYRAGALESLHRPGEQLGEAESTRFWQEIASVQKLLSGTQTILWRVCTAPTSSPAILRQVRDHIDGAEGFYDWGGGLLWIELDPSLTDTGESVIRAAIAKTGGHATLLRADHAQRARIPVFQPLAPPLEALSRRIKTSFDPLGILNPGRMQQES